MTTGRSFLCRKHAASQELEENKPFLNQKCLEVRPASVLEGIEVQIVASGFTSSALPAAGEWTP